MSTGLQILEVELDTFGPKSSPDHALDLITQLEAVEGAARRVLARCREIRRGDVVEWIESNPDHILVCGENRYYVGTTKSVKARCVGDVLEALLEATGGDVDTIVECLAAQPYRQAQVRKVIGKQSWDELFEVTYATDVKTGKAAKQLKVANESWCR